MTLRDFLAAQPPMDTWSSVAALVDKESTEDGWHKTLFSETGHRRKIYIMLMSAEFDINMDKYNVKMIKGGFNIRTSLTLKRK